MNSSILVLIFTQLAALLAYVGCTCPDPDIMIPNLLKIQSDGIELQLSDDNFTYIGDSPTEGISFTISTCGENDSDGYFSIAYCNQFNPYELIHLPSPASPEFKETLEFEWGKASYLTTTAPFKVKFDIYANESNQPRYIDLTFGNASYAANIRINQSALDSE